jgi:outer membrane lipoprotein SlyB
MRRTILTLAAIATAIPASMALPGMATDAQARTRHHHYHSRHYQSTAYYRSQRNCVPSSGTTGLIAGGVGGAVLGSKVIGGGLLGTAVGAAGGALAGRAIDRTITADRRCN